VVVGGSPTDVVWQPSPHNANLAAKGIISYAARPAICAGC
jgi:hypothetical protein